MTQSYWHRYVGKCLHCSGSKLLISARRRSSRGIASCFLRSNVTGRAKSAHHEHGNAPGFAESGRFATGFLFGYVSEYAFKSFTSTLFRTAVVAAALGTLALASQPVTVTMQDGSQVKGSFAGGSADEIKVVVAGQTLTLKTAHYRGREI